MISYSTNWMGPIALRWYDDNNIPFTATTQISRLTNKEITIKTYETYWAVGRIDIYGLDNVDYYDGRSEMSLPMMRQEDWATFSEWLNKVTTIGMKSLDKLLEMYYNEGNENIRWWNYDKS